MHYQRWLMAKGSYFSPSAGAIVKLIDRLRAEKWIGTAGGHAVQTVANTFGDDSAAKRKASVAPLPPAITSEWLEDADREELRLVWPVEGEDPSSVKYPLSHRPKARVSYALELHRAHDYVYPNSDTIGELATACRCGEDLAFEWDEDELVPAFGSSSGIYSECEACSRTFDPSQGTAIITNPFDGTRQEVRGGAAYRFALKVDCGACFAPEPGLTFAPELVTLVEAEFGRDFYEVGSKY